MGPWQKQKGTSASDWSGPDGRCLAALLVAEGISSPPRRGAWLPSRSVPAATPRPPLMRGSHHPRGDLEGRAARAHGLGLSGLQVRRRARRRRRPAWPAAQATSPPREADPAGPALGMAATNVPTWLPPAHGTSVQQELRDVTAALARRPHRRHRGDARATVPSGASGRQAWPACQPGAIGPPSGSMALTLPRRPPPDPDAARAPDSAEGPTNSWLASQGWPRTTTRSAGSSARAPPDLPIPETRADGRGQAPDEVGVQHLQGEGGGELRLIVP